MYAFVLCRWTKLRSSLLPLTIIMEPVSESLILGAIVSWAASTLFGWSPLAFFFVHCLVWFLLDYILLLVVQVLTVSTTLLSKLNCVSVDVICESYICF